MLLFQEIIVSLSSLSVSEDSVSVYDGCTNSYLLCELCLYGLERTSRVNVGFCVP